jgi:hypothetical protein
MAGFIVPVIVVLVAVLLGASVRLVQRSMSRQAEAERERRPLIIAAAGEFQLSAELAEARPRMRRHRG